jgi:hypothetical protein
VEVEAKGVMVMMHATLDVLRDTVDRDTELEDPKSGIQLN